MNQYKIRVDDAIFIITKGTFSYNFLISRYNSGIHFYFNKILDPNLSLNYSNFETKELNQYRDLYLKAIVKFKKLQILL